MTVERTDPPLPLVLASSSPRRRELLEKIGLPIEVIPSPFEEFFGQESPQEEAERLARGKVESLLAENPSVRDRIVLGADTVIDLEGRVLGKPETGEEAASFLEQLAGRSHRVITSLALYAPRSEQSSPSRTATGPNTPSTQILVDSEITRIRVSRLSERERRWYVATGEWRGAAGGYRIQGLGGLFVEGLEGCYFNVMGLPLSLFYGMLQKHGYDLLRGLSGESSAV
jgi:septum formation protein